MALTKLEGIECPTEIANLINQIIDQKSSIDLNDLSEVGEKRFTDLKTSISSLNSALSTLTTTVNSKLSAQVLKAQNGYIKFSKEIILQWGKAQTDKRVKITFPIAFKMKNPIVLIEHGFQPETTVNTFYSLLSGSPTSTSFYIYSNNLTANYWFAIGY